MLFIFVLICIAISCIFPSYIQQASLFKPEEDFAETKEHSKHYIDVNLYSITNPLPCCRHFNLSYRWTYLCFPSCLLPHSVDSRTVSTDSFSAEGRRRTGIAGIQRSKSQRSPRSPPTSPTFLGLSCASLDTIDSDAVSELYTFSKIILRRIIAKVT
jgi:hypothetical protein